MRSGPHNKTCGIAASLRGWAIETALPFWASTGFDRQRGGFHERLHLDGTPDQTVPRRTMAQARQIYVYSHAAFLGWFPEGTALALDALDFLVATCRSPDGKPGFVHRLAPDNSVLDPLRDTYGHAFVLLALGWLARASGDAQVRALVDDTLAFLDEHLTAPDGTLFEGLPRCEPRRQNPHMHAFEAMLALHETIKHPTALHRAEALGGLLEARFLDPQTQTLGEYFTDRWAPWPEPQGGGVEPGHHAEWSWLLRYHGRLVGRNANPMADALLGTALASAHPDTGFIVDELDRAGNVRRASRRCWPQTELAKALLAAAEAWQPAAAAAAERLLTGVATHYLSGTVAGGWIDHFDEAGHRLVDHIPASTFYHLFCAIAEADRVLPRQATPRS